MARRGFTWSRSVASGANVTGVLELRAEDQAATQLISGVAPFIFDENGRISTSSHAGAAITVPDSYTFGEMWELRYTFAETGNSQRQIFFAEARSGVANSSTIRAGEFRARQSGAVNIGTLEGLNVNAYAASGGAGDISNYYGITGELQTDSTYTGTVTLGAAVRGKVQIEDGATYTAAYVFQADLEAVTGGARVTALMGVGTVGGAATARYLIDTSAVESTNGAGGEVVILKFKDAGGTVQYLIHDTDSATAVSVTSTDPTS